VVARVAALHPEGAERQEGVPKPIVFSVHAREKMLDRGASESEVEMAIRTGSSEPAQSKKNIRKIRAIRCKNKKTFVKFAPFDAKKTFVPFDAKTKIENPMTSSGHSVTSPSKSPRQR